jgi:hypothetical protein
LNLYELTHPIRRGLARLRGRVRSLLLLYGSSRAIVFLVSALVVLFVADYMLRLPLGVRRLTFTLLVGSLAVVLYRRLVAPLRRPLHDATLAARVEERFPLLENRLVSPRPPTLHPRSSSTRSRGPVRRCAGRRVRVR